MGRFGHPRGPFWTWLMGRFCLLRGPFWFMGRFGIDPSRPGTDQAARSRQHVVHIHCRQALASSAGHNIVDQPSPTVAAESHRGCPPRGGVVQADPPEQSKHPRYHTDCSTQGSTMTATAITTNSFACISSRATSFSSFCIYSFPENIAWE